MIKRTSHPQNRMVVWPLYLPQVYWVILTSSHNEVVRELLLGGKITAWEAEFFGAIEMLHFKHKRPNSGYWSEGFNQAVIKRTKKEPFSSKGEVGEFLIKQGEKGPLAMNDAAEGRIDIKLSRAAEAIGLVNLDNDETATKFFFSLLPNQASGQQAVALMLSKIMGLSEPTFQNVTSPPREILVNHLNGKQIEEKEYLEGTVPKQHPKATLFAYIDGMRDWFNLEPSSDSAKLISRLVNLIPSAPKPMDESWRDQIPDQKTVNALLSLIGTPSITKIENANSENGPMRTKAKNIILVGPPGTGKSKTISHLALKLARGEKVTEEEIYDLEKAPPKSLKGEPGSANVIWTQFHPSYSYEDFVEGIRPVSNMHDISKVRYSVVPGPLKALAQLARVYCWERAEGKDPFSIPILCYVDKINKSIGIPKEYAHYNLSSREGILHLKTNDGTLVSFAKTGGGKIEPLLPLEGDDPKYYQELFWAPSQLEVQHFVLVIDEINRGNTAKIFGELLSLIEPSKRLGESDAIEVSLAYSKEPFALPPNLHIISTMNQADRSLSVMDQAFRRRFKLVYLVPNFDLIRNEVLYKKCSGKERYDKNVNTVIAQHFDNINAALEKCEIPDSQHIGHSYAFEVVDAVLSGKSKIEDALVDTWNSDLHSLIREILPESSVEDFLKHFSEIEKEKPSVKLNDFESTFKRSTPHYKAA